VTLETLRLFHFRNFGEVEIGFENRSAVVWGPNGRGKTNLLESIFVLGTTRSHRTRRDGELVRFGAAGFALSALFRADDGRASRVSLTYEEKTGKKASVDGKEAERLSSLVGRTPVVLVSPEDAEITRGEPERRRYFLDLTLCTTSELYLRTLQKYNRAHKQRGRVLREEKGADIGRLLDPWDRQLAEAGVPLASLRRAAIDELSPVAEDVYGELGGGETLSIRYAPGSGEEAASEKEFAAALRKRRAHDIRTGRTSVGPHRDDVELLLDGRPLRNYGSRGQHRTAVLALKIAAGRTMKKKLGEEPIVLLDDVFTELDEKRSLSLAGHLRKEGQLVVTGTDGEELCRFFPDANRFSLAGAGRLKREG